MYSYHFAYEEKRFREGMCDRLMFSLIPKDVHVYCVHGKRYLTGQMEFANVINLGSWDGEVILDCLAGLPVIPRVLVRGSKEVKGRRRRWGDRNRGWNDVFWKWKKGPRAKECRWPLETGRDKKTDSPLKPPEGIQRPVNTTILDLRTVREYTCIALSY